MRRIGYILPLVISGCQGESVGLTSSGDGASADLLRILTQGQARSDFAANFAAVRNLGVSQWVSAARSELSDASVVIDGQTFTNLRSELQFTPAMLNSLVGINNTFRSLATIMRMYGVQNAAKISTDDVTEYMKLAAAGLNYARGGSFTQSVAPAAWLRAFNVGFALTAAAHDSVESPLAAATTNGLFFAFYGGFLNPPKGAELALDAINPSDGCDDSAARRYLNAYRNPQTGGYGWSRCGTALALLATVTNTNNNGNQGSTSSGSSGNSGSSGSGGLGTNTGMCDVNNGNTGPGSTNNNNGGTNNNNNGGSNSNNNGGSSNTNNNGGGVGVTSTTPLNG